MRGDQGLGAARPARASPGRRRHRPRSQDRPVDRSTLYNYGTLPGRGEPLELGRAADQELHDERLTARRGHEATWEAPEAPRGLRPPRPPVQRLRHAPLPHAGDPRAARTRARSSTSPSTRAGRARAGPSALHRPRSPVSWLNTQIDRACVDVNEFGWVCGWVMECMEKGYITEQQLGFRLDVGRRRGRQPAAPDDRHARGLRRRARRGRQARLGEASAATAAECAIYTMKGASPRGHDHRGRWEEMLDTCTSSNGHAWRARTRRSRRRSGCRRASIRSTASRWRGWSAGSAAAATSRTRWAAASSPPHPHRESGRALSRRHRLGLHARRRDALRPADRRDPARLQPALRHRPRASSTRPRATARSRSTAPRRSHDVRKQWERMLDVWYETVGYDRKTGKPKKEPPALARPRLARERPLREEVDGGERADCRARRSRRRAERI